MAKNTKPLFAVVYGREWEDIMYFADEHVAKTKLIIQSVIPEPGFYPTMNVYHEDHNGVYQRSKRFWHVNPAVMKELIATYTRGEIFKNPELAMSSIVEKS